MEPETIEETKARQVGTPVNPRKRASVMPSEPAVAEESEDGKTTDVTKNVERTVYEIEEDESGVCNVDCYSFGTDSLRFRYNHDVCTSCRCCVTQYLSVSETKIHSRCGRVR